MVLKKILSKSFIPPILLLLTLLLGIFKNYVWLPFRTGAGEIVVREFSFLSITILGYGLYFPFFVIVITTGLLLFSILRLLISSTKSKSKIFVILVVIDIVCIILPILIGMQIFNIGILYMLALLICNLILSLCQN